MSKGFISKKYVCGRQPSKHPVLASLGNNHGTSSLPEGKMPSLALPSAWAQAQLSPDPLAVREAGQEKQGPERKFSTASPPSVAYCLSLPLKIPLSSQTLAPEDGPRSLQVTKLSSSTKGGEQSPISE